MYQEEYDRKTHDDRWPSYTEVAEADLRAAKEEERYEHPKD